MKKLKQYAGNQLKKLSDNLEACLAAPRGENLHKARVRMKKLKTIFHLFESSHKGFKARKKFRDFKKIFSEAGHIRDFELTRSFEKRAGISCSKREEKEKLKKDTKRFLELLPSFLENLPQLKKKITRLTHKVNDADKKNYVVDIKKKLRYEIKQRATRERLHVVRKLLKELLYLSSFIKWTGVRQYDSLQKLIGSWLDLQIFLSWSRKHCKLKRANALAPYQNKSQRLLKKIKSLLNSSKTLANKAFQ